MADSSAAVDRLAEIGQRAATLVAGPWVFHANTIWPGTKQQMEALDADPEAYDTDDWPNPIDNSDFDEDLGEFVAHAREDVPVMVATLRALLDYHTPVEQRVGPPLCGGCSTSFTSTMHPCATVRIIELELAR